jgi:SAM-dependent MidA family methyltransferase
MSDRLRERLIARIKESGPLRFDEFMEAALYDPDDGFFSSVSPARAQGDFITSPHLSPVFSGLLAVQARAMWDSLEQPSPFTVVDLGAGEGALARGVARAAQSDEAFARTLRVVAVERGTGARDALSAGGLETFSDLGEMGPFDGVVIANELLDNVPFRLYDGDVEIVIDADGDVLTARPPLATASRVVSARATEIVGQISKVLRRGYAIVIDYGFVTGEEPESVRGYRAHHLVDDLLQDPGGTDITGPVDFDALVARANADGLQTWGPVSQRDALMSLGYRATLDRMRTDQADKERAGEWRAAVEFYGERGQAAMLVDPASLGGLKVLFLGTAGVPRALGAG